MRIHLLGNLLPTMPSKNCNIRDRVDILKKLGINYIYHENFVPKTLFDFLMKYTKYTTKNMQIFVKSTQKRHR